MSCAAVVETTSVSDSSRSSADTSECGFPDAVLADEEDGARGLLLERCDDVFDELAPASHQQRLRPVERTLPDSPDPLQLAEGAPLLEARPELGAELVPIPVDECLQGADLVERDPVERARGHTFAVRDAILDELDDHVLADGLERGQD